MGSPVYVQLKIRLARCGDCLCCIHFFQFIKNKESNYHENN